MRQTAIPAPLVCVAVGFLLGGCDQSVNITGSAETKLTGMYCDAKDDQGQNCKPGDVVVTIEGREHLLCDWGWQIIHQPASNEVLCVHRGALREGRPPASTAH